MKKSAVVLFVLVISALFLLLLAGCSGDKNTDAACLYQTSVDLDKGNYDAVLASSCANAMQIGAAWFGKAGYEITSVINGFIDANDSNQTNSDLNIYMTSLTGDVTAATLDNLDKARTAYGSVSAADASYLDAQFYIGLVDAMKTMTVIKLVIPDSVTSDGEVDLTCDKNLNDVPDDTDATSCALIAADNISSGATLTCNGATYIRSNPIDINLVDSSANPVTGIYSGIIVTITGSGTPGCGTNTYNRLLYKEATNTYWAATTSPSENCTGTDGLSYNCPVLSNLDLVATINTSLDNSSTALDTAITGTSDVTESVDDIKAENCCTDAGEDSGNPGACTCSSAEIADYLQKI